MIENMKKTGSIIAGTTGIIAIAVSNLGTYMHEYGHKVFSESLFTGPEGSITINSFIDTLRGKEYYFGFYERGAETGLTSLGNLLGEDLSNAMVSAAGPGVDLATSLGSYAVGSCLNEKRPYTSLAMKTAGILYFLSPLNHAIGASTLRDGYNDINKFAEGIGVPDNSAAAVVALSLPILAISLRKIKKNAKMKKSTILNSTKNLV